MPTLIILSLALGALLLFTGCSKDSDSTSDNPQTQAVIEADDLSELSKDDVRKMLINLKAGCQACYHLAG